MSDFFQNGTIATLHNLVNRPVEELENELERFAVRQNLTLILPALFSELEGDALPGILEHLKKVKYLEEIVVGLDRADENKFKHAINFFSELPQKVTILWQDGPGLRGLDAKLQEQNLAPTEEGKGRNVWYCMGYILAKDQAHSVAIHDCDVVTYKRDMLARLLYPVANPNLPFAFCKGYYSRVAGNKMGGRVSRLFVTPLIRSLEQVLGPHDFLEFLDSFRYPLAGEFAFRKGFIRSLRIPGDWGLEVGVLAEAYRTMSRNMICQTDIADQYDHKHQDLSAEDPQAGLRRMTTDIAKSLFRKLAAEGCAFSDGLLRTIKAVYNRRALEFMDFYAYDARINGLTFDRHSEEAAIEAFQKSLVRAGEEFLYNPLQAPFIPNWSRVFSAHPEISDQLIATVEADNARFK